MKSELIVRTTDSKARISLPKGFADVTVLIEQLSDSEVRIRKAKVVPEDEIPFAEEVLKPLSDRDRDFFLSVLDNPPPPSPALIRMLERGRKVMEGQPESEGADPGVSPKPGRPELKKGKEPFQIDNAITGAFRKVSEIAAETKVPEKRILDHTKHWLKKGYRYEIRGPKGSEEIRFAG